MKSLALLMLVLLTVDGAYFQELDRALGRVAARYGRGTAVRDDLGEALDELSASALRSKEEVDASANWLARHQREAVARAAAAEGKTIEEYFAAHDGEIWPRFALDLDLLRANAPLLRHGELLGRLIAAREYLGLQRIKPWESKSHEARRLLESFADETFKTLGLRQIRATLPADGDDDSWNYLLGSAAE